MRSLVKLICLVIGITFLGLACGPANTQNEYYLLTKLGNDTLAVEKIIQQKDSLDAQILLRSPKLRELEYGFSLNAETKLLLKGVISDGVSGELLGTQMASWDGDSLYINLNSGEREKKIAANKDILPFIDMVHWPFDLMLRNAKGLAIGDTLDQLLWSGTRTLSFKVARVAPDSLTVKHPSRGVMGVKVNKNGELLLLDAGQTTRKLTVARVEALDYEVLKSSFVESERSGKEFGALSGRGKLEKEINGINFTIDYGTPAKRGRTIWGGIVKYDERWRTGANRATHFAVSEDVLIGDLEVPAGEYTFFTIPQENSMTLIINTQTGQNGRTYDESKDLGRVELSTRILEEEVEIFTIDLVSRDHQVFLSLQWDTKAYEVDIK